MHALLNQTRTDRALAAHERYLNEYGFGLCGRVAVSVALDLHDRGYDAHIETAVVSPKRKAGAHAYVVVGDTVIDPTMGYEGPAEEYRERKVVVDHSTLRVFNRRDIRRLAKRARSEDKFSVELFKISNPAVFAHVCNNS